MEIRAPWQPWRRGESRSEDSGEAGEGPAGPVPDELAARRAEIARMEERALREVESLGVQRADLERRAQALEDRERNLSQQSEELKRAKRVQRRELERISSLSAAQAKQLLLAEVEQEARHQAGVRLQEMEAETKREAERRARNILSVAMQRLAARHASDSTTRLVELPSDEMKGRIIGRDGRNIRTLEKLTGVDVIIDETPAAVVLSSFDGVRREIARITLERLIADGRINPALIEETYEHAKVEIEERITQEGERAALEARVHGVDPELIRLLGQLKFRTSYGQNVLEHLVECSHLAGLIAGGARGLGGDRAPRRAASRHRQGGDPRGRGPARVGWRQHRPPPRRARSGRARDGGPSQRRRAPHGRGGDRADGGRPVGSASRRSRRLARAVRRAPA